MLSYISKLVSYMYISVLVYMYNTDLNNVSRNGHISRFILKLRKNVLLKLNCINLVSIVKLYMHT